MYTDKWQKSSYCQEGEACLHIAGSRQRSSHCGQGESCVHIAATISTIHLTESADPTRAMLSASPTAFHALLQMLELGSPTR
ncbi:hypothetical protein GCM10010145_02210 [Streptomyces ruber]|uniref:DUF397 domain-containing protein n=2 Tax=Streptomyces TaxID=1883 RepID=A0A918B6X4_9ACTN|nr:DUF397 domain-containing protein [Streptomyces ruber]GGQ38448.1 hypothetical protein GCM10010145_02210 [Streptomyces ruber]